MITNLDWNLIDARIRLESAVFFKINNTVRVHRGEKAVKIKLIIARKYPFEYRKTIFIFNFVKEEFKAKKNKVGTTKKNVGAIKKTHVNIMCYNTCYVCTYVISFDF